jgi:hypothetical protein
MAAVSPAPYGARRQRCLLPCSRVCLATGSASAASRLHVCSITRRLARSAAPPRAGSRQLRSLHGYSLRSAASGATRPQIQALCRWQTEETLNIYARLNEETYTSLLRNAHAATGASTRTTSIEGIVLDGEDSIRALLAADLSGVTMDA